MKKELTINYDVRKQPVIFWAAAIISGLLIINLILFLVFDIKNVILIFSPIVIGVGLWIYKDILILEYNVLKWYEKNIFIRDKNQDAQILKNQIIKLEQSKGSYIISFKKMGYFTEDQIAKFGILLNDFIKGYEINEIEPDNKYYHIPFKPNRTRINLNEVQFSDLIFPDKSGYRIDSSLTIPFHHHIIVGASGLGKSWLVQNFYYPLLSEVGDIHIIDIKNTTPDKWRINYTKDIEGGLNALKTARMEMERRYREEEYNERPYFLVIEEVQAFKIALDKEQAKEYEKDLKSILVLGRECKVFIFFISQFANVGADGVFSNSGTRAQFNCRINLGTPTQQQCEQVFNISKSDLPPRLNNKIGTGFIQIDDHVYFIEFPTKLEVKNEKERV